MPEILITAPAESQGEGGAGVLQGGRQDFLQKCFWSLKIPQQLVIQLFPPLWVDGMGGLSLGQQPTGQQFLRDPAPKWKPVCVTTEVSTATI